MPTFNPSRFRWQFLCFLAWVAGCSPTVPVPASSPALAAHTQPAADSSSYVCPEGYVRIAPGTFTMGSPEGEVNSDEARHSVTITRGYCLKATEVTQGEWQAVTGFNPSAFKICGANCPVEQVSWEDAVGYANALSRRDGLPECYAGSTFAGLGCRGYRLPTEAEWEYAARAGTTGATLGCEGYPLFPTEIQCYGNLDSLSWHYKNSGKTTHPVRQKQPNAWGLYDMLGNVWEWTGDWYGSIYGTATDPLGGGDEARRVHRGGSWNHTARFLRASYRTRASPDSRSYYIGFRLSMTITRGCGALPANATAGVEAANASGWGACEVSACATSYHLESGACLSDTSSCSPMPANTTAGTQTWNRATNAYGVCTATACGSGYTVSAGVCVPSGYSLGTVCTLSSQCRSGICATGPIGTATERCAPSSMNYIPAGTFTMGSPSGEAGQGLDETQHSVTISRSFFLGQTEVTQAQWKALSGGINPSYFQSSTGTVQTTSNANDSGPVESLDWYSAAGFANARSEAEGLTSCYKLKGCINKAHGWKDGLHSGCMGATFVGLTCTGYRLPTESEWEYAARGGTTSATFLGDLNAHFEDCTRAQFNLESIAWWCGNAGGRPQAVGGKTANSFGLYDVLGNVNEWTGDNYGPYPGTVTDPIGIAEGSHAVVRGGSWLYGGSYSRAANRGNYTADYRDSILGFRLAMTAP